MWLAPGTRIDSTTAVMDIFFGWTMDDEDIE
jgi:hypothetical protein